MEEKVIQKILEATRKNKGAALCTITNTYGSSPGKEGFMMAVFEDGNIIGTVGGGILEGQVTKDAVEAIKLGKSVNKTYILSDAGLKSKCGGKVDVFIKTFSRRNKLIIVGGGHVALEIYKFAKLLDFYIVIFEDREEFANKERFEDADEIIVGDIGKELENYNIDENCFIVIVTRGHEQDEIALKSVINSSANYIGMIGSINKVRFIFDRLKQEGLQEQIKRVYAPIGLRLGGDTPSEIALSILSEIMLVKNKGRLEHSKFVEF
ncbi:putative xanthine dehydrogenase subunit A [Caloramator mitchellensis]|uniref:Putative xanthine dehydrogenase subunit A n=1 Tax=Caloramator mitchellensis TaxID=908809 RepID=A0A0R3JWW5_CALMK|nr:XdhC/CoxI family protein [Caloramator mitchellensis]KRQ87546.1 putative xanthine dehydrogenase subunit A [Caloramator mitchellensis]